MSIFLLGAVLAAGGAAIMGIQTYFERHERRRAEEEERHSNMGYVMQFHAAIEFHRQRVETMHRMGIHIITDMQEFADHE